MAGTAVIIVAAGRGRRFGATTPKQFLDLNGKPLLRMAVEAFAGHPAVDRLQLVIDMNDADRVAEALHGIDHEPPVAGGDSRQASVRAGLTALARHAPERVLIHDAARPLVDAGLIDRVLAALDHAPGAIPALGVVDTLKRLDADGMVAETVPRDGLWRAQTPQGFRYPDIVRAHDAAVGAEMTDDAAVAAALGLGVAVVDGDENNLKVTTPGDLRRLEELMNPRSPAAAVGEFRVGNGFDVHRLGPGDGVMLCGVLIPCDLTLIGHSDADAALHAVTDAVLGAIAMGDIGSHFPPSDARWRGASSDRFLFHACQLMRDQGFEISNIDLTIMCERPKIGPHRDEMRARLAEIAGVGIGRVAVKATTTERLGFTGRGEGLAAQASVLLNSLR